MKTKTPILFRTVLLSAVVLILTGCSADMNEKPAAVAPAAENTVNVSLSLDNGTDKNVFPEKFESGQTVFELMKKLNDVKKLEMKYQESSAGAFIEEINGVANDAGKNTYWMLYINDQLSNVGASDTKLNSGDKVEWRYIDTTDMYK